MTAETTAAAHGERAPRRDARRAIGGIALLNGAIALTAIVTGPLVARALGPDGRGDLAAVVTTVMLLPFVADFGLSTFTARATAQGVAARRLIGTVGALCVALGLLVVALSPLIAQLVAGDRSQVRTLLLVGLATMPIVLAGNVLTGINWGRADWRRWAVVRAIPPLGGLLAAIALTVAGALTVTSAALVAIGLSLVAIVPVLPLLWEGGRPRFERPLAGEALSFGSRTWLSTIAAEANLRLDQLLMTRLVPSRELGLYVVAVNVAMVQNAFTSAVLSVLFPRVSAGDGDLTARALRTTVTLVALGSLALQGVVGWAIPLLFGDDFGPAVAMARILLVAAVPQTATLVLSTALIASGRPGATARAQVLSLGLTIPGLLLVLGPLGGVGAALVSLAAYTVTAAYLLWQAHERLGLGWRELVVVRRSDLAAVVTPLLARVRRRGRA